MSGCCARTKTYVVKWPNAKNRLPSAKSRSRTRKSKSRTRKSKSRIWSVNWRDGKGTRGKVTTKGEPRRHQVTEVPPVKAHITEYQFPNVVCGQCGKATRASLPEEIAGQFGRQLTALIAYWTVVCRLPRRLVEAMLSDVLGIEISLGSTQKAWEEVSQAVAQPVAQLQEQLPREAVLNVDETGWRTNGDKRWIWGLVAKQFVFYVVASTRGTEVLVSLLGTVFRGILCSDRWVVYLTYHSVACSSAGLI